MSADERPPAMPDDHEIAALLMHALVSRYGITRKEAVDWLAWFVDATDAAARK